MRRAVTLTAVSLFAGVGGFDLAMQRNGIHVVAAVEIDDKARAVLARRFPDTRLFPDVTKVSAHDLRDAGFVPNRGIITGGFPCQDLSVAGRRKGLAGERSGLFWHIIRLVDELHPRWIVLENVPGLLSSEGGRDMGIVLGALGECGYGVAYRVLDAQHFGVPQRRRRVFIVAGRGAGAADSAGPVQILLEPEGSAGNPAKGWTAGQEVAGTLGGGSGSRGWAADTDRMTFVPVVRDVMNTIPASIYHHGNAVHQDVMAGHLLVVDE
jgi:DNA (cytosine-5)-methyltransferase 1